MFILRQPWAEASGKPRLSPSASQKELQLKRRSAIFGSQGKLMGATMHGATAQGFARQDPQGFPGTDAIAITSGPGWFAASSGTASELRAVVAQAAVTPMPFSA